MIFFMGTEYSKTLFLWVKEDEIFVNFKLGNHKDLSQHESESTLFSTLCMNDETFIIFYAC